ncbi:odorant receptor Or2-like [Sabethes cyaneus]|uniref:odorant receptor Or2-like n=1 Tax=Sabethes cyaneus TaxID=53552 RepID=UPI00237D5856|nr:odorant receptor Or2-like [Sabethes cyaneus]
MISTDKPSNFSHHNQILSVGLTALRTIGLWEATNRSWYRLMVLCLALILLPPKVIFGSGSATFDSFVRNLSEIIFICENCAWLIIFTYHRDSFRMLVELLNNFVNREWPSEMRTQMAAFNRTMNKSAKLYAVFVSAVTIFFIVLPVVSSVVRFYGLNIRRDLGSYFIYTAFSIVVAICCGYCVLLKGTIDQVLIQYGSKMFEMVSKRIEAMQQLVDSNKRRSEFRRIIELHNLSLDYLHYLESTVSISLLATTISCMLMWGLMMFYLSNNFSGPNGISILSSFIVLLEEMIVYSINGTLLQSKAAGISSAMYTYPWHRESVVMQRAAKFVIQRAQRPVGITAARFHYIDLKRLGSMVQASYSYYLLLKDRF